jgi:hypothetical protein
MTIQKWNPRPLAVTVLGFVYIAVGTVGFVYHFPALRAFQSDIVWVELVRVSAIVCGVFMLRGQNWARWGAVAWIAFHAVISAFHSVPQFAIHCLFCALIAWFLFRPDSTRYFRAARTRPA